MALFRQFLLSINAHAVELSWLNVDQLRSLVRQAFYARRVGNADAFLLAFDEGASYDSPNFIWVPATLYSVCVRGPDRRCAVDAGTWVCARALYGFIRGSSPGSPPMSPFARSTATRRTRPPMLFTPLSTLRKSVGQTIHQWQQDRPLPRPCTLTGRG